MFLAAAEETIPAVVISPWILAALPLVGVIVGALLNELRSWVQSRRDHQRWLRERRFESYTALATLLRRVERSFNLIRSLNAQVDQLNTRLADHPSSDELGKLNPRKDRLLEKLRSFDERSDRLLEEFSDVAGTFDVLGPDSLNDEIGKLAESLASSDPETIKRARESFIKVARGPLQIKG